MNNRPAMIKISHNGYVSQVTGGEFNDMKDVIKSVKKRRFNGDDKCWEIGSESWGELKTKCDALGFSITAEDEVIDAEFLAEDNSNDTTGKSTNIEVRENTGLAQKQSTGIQEIYTEQELMTILNITEAGLPEYGIDGEKLINTVKSTMLYHLNKGVSGRDFGLYPHEALILSINAIRMGVNTSSFSCWDNDGKVIFSLNYQVATEWIQYNMPKRVIYTFEVGENERYKHTQNIYNRPDIYDIVYKACLLTQEQAKEARILANEIRRDFREMRNGKPSNPLEYQKEWDMAENMAFEQCATVVGIGVFEAKEAYAIKWGETKKGKKYPVTDENGAFIIETYYGSDKPKTIKQPPKGRGYQFVVKKRAIVDSAMQLGEINLNNIDESSNKFNPKVMEFLAENPEYNYVPDDSPAKQSALLSIGGKKNKQIEAMTLEERTDLLHGEEFEGHD